MSRETWNRLMITAMAALIVFDVQQLWSLSGGQEDRFPYLLSLGIAVLVIVLKVREIRQARAPQDSDSVPSK